MRVKHAVVLLMLFSPLTWAGNMTFQFRNPNFGGNPNNGSFLLNSAQAQNSYKDPAYDNDFGIEPPSALDNFTQAIQSQILGGLLTNINTGKPGRMVTNDFIIDIANRDGQLQLNVTDRKTGRTSTIEVSGLQTQSTDFKLQSLKDINHAALTYFGCRFIVERMLNCPAETSCETDINAPRTKLQRFDALTCSHR